MRPVDEVVEVVVAGVGRAGLERSSLPRGEILSAGIPTKYDTLEDEIFIIHFLLLILPLPLYIILYIIYHIY